MGHRRPILVQSRIDVPKSLGTLPKDKPVIAGVAWAQHRGIEKVEIRIDDGEWQDAKLAADAGIDLWRQWSYVYDGPAGRHSAQVRATDLTGSTQPERAPRSFPPARAAGTRSSSWWTESDPGRRNLPGAVSTPGRPRSPLRANQTRNRLRGLRDLGVTLRATLFGCVDDTVLEVVVEQSERHALQR